jgi:Tfp pilus assembly protein PilF
MNNQAKQERQRQLARVRSARRRARERARNELIGATKFKMKIGAGTVADIECIRLTGGFEESAEAVTLAIRYMAKLARQSPATFRKAMNPRAPQ